MVWKRFSEKASAARATLFESSCACDGADLLFRLFRSLPVLTLIYFLSRYHCIIIFRCVCFSFCRPFVYYAIYKLVDCGNEIQTCFAFESKCLKSISNFVLCGFSSIPYRWHGQSIHWNRSDQNVAHTGLELSFAWSIGRLFHHIG